MFRIQQKMCRTCIYRSDSHLDLAELEAEVADRCGGFCKHRLCHHADDIDGVCCHGFWTRHKDKFPLGQIAQRLNTVEFVDVDELEREGG